MPTLEHFASLCILFIRGGRSRYAAAPKGQHKVHVQELNLQEISGSTCTPGRVHLAVLLPYGKNRAMTASASCSNEQFPCFCLNF
ncbi:unnamed protein product [Calypogeia fissa]